MKEFENAISNWNNVIGKHSDLLREQLSDLEISALSACIRDCCQSFHEVYSVLLDKIKNADPQDYNLLHDCVVDMYWEFDHIKNHIIDAENGFTALMDLLAKKADSREKR